MFLHFNETKNEFAFDELTNKNVTHIEKIGDGDLIIIADNQIYKYVVYTNEINLFPGLANFQANSIRHKRVLSLIFLALEAIRSNYLRLLETIDSNDLLEIINYENALQDD